MAASGTIAITSRDFEVTAPRAPLIAERKAWRFWIFVPLRLGLSTPAFSLREVKTSSCDDFSAARAAITLSTVISHARLGRGLYCGERSIPLPGSLDERDLVDLLQGGDTGLDPGQRRLAQEPHAFFVCCPADLRRRPLLQNQLADAVRKIEQFVDGGSPMI